MHKSAIYKNYERLEHLQEEICWSDPVASSFYKLIHWLMAKVSKLRPFLVTILFQDFLTAKGKLYFPILSYFSLFCKTFFQKKGHYCLEGFNQ